MEPDRVGSSASPLTCLTLGVGAFDRQFMKK